MMKISNLLRAVPFASKLRKGFNALVHHVAAPVMDENRYLKSRIQELITTDVTSTVETNLPPGIDADGLPVPGTALRYLVAGTEDVAWFLDSGKLTAETVTDILAAHHLTLDSFRKVLDFGCGCGRVLRHLRRVKTRHGVDLYGTDCNVMAVQWCQRFLDFAEFDKNALHPPLRYADGTFDLIYAFSILTHLTEDLQKAWMNEFRRILTRAGHLILSVHGDMYIDQNLHVLSPSEIAEYRRGHLVIKETEMVGTNFCGALHPEEYVRSSLAVGFRVIDFVPGGARGCPPQDVYLLQRETEN
jgi:SAM-dependent methyltransferase